MLSRVLQAFTAGLGIDPQEKGGTTVSSSDKKTKDKRVYAELSKGNVSPICSETRSHFLAQAGI